MRLPFEFTLAGCTSLRTLALRCPIALRSKVPWVNALLADVNPTRLESINLEIRLLGSLYDALDWRRMDNTLTQGDFKSLKNVAVKVAVWHTATERAQDMEAFVRAQLPRLDSRYMLRRSN